ncbi:hypothetical protein Pelo_8508 [Pelomyxa schiedti]|nr:hypothetical protein Pelo_8508 [Pelomyxa schiedti]
MKNPESTCMRLPFGYSMDHFYFYQRFRWEVPCSDKKSASAEAVVLVQLAPGGSHAAVTSLKVLKRWPSTPKIRKTLLWISSLAWPPPCVSTHKPRPTENLTDNSGSGSDPLKKILTSSTGSPGLR